MSPAHVGAWSTPHERDLGLHCISNVAGLAVSILPNGSLFALEHSKDDICTLISQVLGSPLDGGIGRILLRIGGASPVNIEALGSRATVRLGIARDRVLWEGVTGPIRHRVTLCLLPYGAAWLWRVEATNLSQVAMPLDAIFVQDLGLGLRAFVTNNEAYASQYIDHHVARHARYGPVVMSRQNLAQDGKHPWVVHGCLDRASAFATDAMQVFGPGYRDSDAIPHGFGSRLADHRLQHEGACAAIQSLATTLEPHASASWDFFGLYVAHHPEPSDDADLTRLDTVVWPERHATPVARREVRRSLAQDAPSVRVAGLSRSAVQSRYAHRFLEESDGDRLMSFFTGDPSHNRHVVLRDKERIVTRRHGAILRTGQAMLPDESTMCTTCWMHGVFAAQLTIGNTSFHKLFGVSRDPYNIVRSGGLRVLVDAGHGWCLLTVPSAFEMGLSDCRWIYVLVDRVITVRAIAAGEDPAVQWRISIDGEPCRLLVFGQLVLGEREFEHRAIVMADPVRSRFTFRPDPESLWGKHYPDAVYHLVTSTPDVVDEIGGDELLYADGAPGSGGYVAVRTKVAREFCFAVVGSLTNSTEAGRLASKYEEAREDDELLAPAAEFWTGIARRARVVGEADGTAALNASLPWLVHDAMIHLTVPHGLEQYTGAAWGTRDVCQGPVEFLLALEHDHAVKEILRIVFAQQYAMRGDWPQWFMLKPYSSIQDMHSHGDVIVWPLKALNDYLEATNDLGFLDETLPWCDDETLEPTGHEASVAAHVEKLLATVRARFIPGTRLIRYGEGDWNDSLQPADPALRDVMVSSWTVALLYQQLARYADILDRVGAGTPMEHLSELALAIRSDFNRFLVRDGTVAGYALFEPGIDALPELLLHPSDVRTGLQYSLLPMTRSILAGLFTDEQAQHHLRIIRDHLLFPDGARLADRPVAYQGGRERTFRRAESASFFGREIGLMYVHAHLRYAEALAILGDADALWDALHVANPVSVTERVRNAMPRQRNAYFSSSDAAFADRYQASDSWCRTKAGTIAVEGGWRIYSSGPGLYLNVLIRHALGIRRFFGDRVHAPVLPARCGELKLAWDCNHRRGDPTGGA